MNEPKGMFKFVSIKWTVLVRDHDWLSCVQIRCKILTCDRHYITITAPNVIVAKCQISVDKQLKDRREERAEKERMLKQSQDL